MPFAIQPAQIIDVTLYTLLAFSLITWVLILGKTWQFASNRRLDDRYRAAFWDAPSLGAARQLSPALERCPVARIAAAGHLWLQVLQCSARLSHAGPVADMLARTLHGASRMEQGRLESGLPMLASIGSTAPFVGLFGTVMGIMLAMHDISASLDVVAGPIGDALVATAIGIAVAVPAVLAYNFFMRAGKQHRQSLKHFVDGYLLLVRNDPTAIGQE